MFGTSRYGEHATLPLPLYITVLVTWVVEELTEPSAGSSVQEVETCAGCMESMEETIVILVEPKRQMAAKS